MGFGLGGRRGRIGAILSRVSSSAAENTEIVIETALAFLQSELSVLPELIRVVLGKFGLVRFEALFAKPETKPFGFFQIF